VSAWLQELSGGNASPYRIQLAWLADRVAVNRERAGLHYPSDTAGGVAIAAIVFNAMKVIAVNGADPWVRADPAGTVPATAPGPVRTLAALVTAARAEWPASLIA
jgi:hypothetical protein